MDVDASAFVVFLCLFIQDFTLGFSHTGLENRWQPLGNLWLLRKICIPQPVGEWLLEVAGYRWVKLITKKALHPKNLLMIYHLHSAAIPFNLCVRWRLVSKNSATTTMLQKAQLFL